MTGMSMQLDVDGVLRQASRTIALGHLAMKGVGEGKGRDGSEMRAG